MDKLNEFHGYFIKQDEPGLILAKDELMLNDVKTFFLTKGFGEATNWKTLLDSFKKGEQVFFVLSSMLSKELYDAIVQYSERKGRVQIMDKEKMQYLTIEADVKKTKLLIMSTNDNFRKIQEKFSIINKIGLTLQI